MNSTPHASNARSNQLSIALLGAPQIEQGGQPVEVDTRKAIAILAYIAIEKGVHSRDTLAALLWPESDESRARAALRRTLSPLRQAVDEEYLQITRDTVELIDNPGLWIDIDEFRKIAHAHQDHSQKTGFCVHCGPDLTRAAALYRDDFMAGFTLRDSAEFDDWQFYQSETMRREYTAVLEKLVFAEAARGEMESAIQYARRRLAIDPLHEPAHRQLMRLYVWADRRSAALHQYQECARILQDELGVEPLGETQELYAAIRENMEIPKDLAIHAADQTEIIQPPATAALSASQRYPLVGRARELTLLMEMHKLAAEGGRFGLILGEAGVGKTRLAREFLQAVQEDGARVVLGRAFHGEEDLAYAPLAGAIREALEYHPQAQREIDPAWSGEASRLLPELSEGMQHPDFTPENDSGAQTRLYEAFTQVLLTISEGPRPGVIYFDDLHWADESTIEFLAYLSRRLHTRSRLLLLSWRSEEVGQNSILERLRTEAQRSRRGEVLQLSRLTPDEVDTLIANLPDRKANITSDLGARLYQETEGLPFLLIEYLESLASGGLKGGGENWALTPGGRDLLHTRLSGIGETGLQLLQTAAVIGRECDFDILREVSGRTEEEVIFTLETLVGRGLLQETERDDGIALDFSHHKLRALIYEEISSLRRRLLHRRVAQTLVSFHRSRDKTAAPVGLAAHHYRLGGLPEEAAQCHVLAGDQSVNLLAHTEALAHYQSALAMGFSEPAVLAEKIADVQVLQGNYQAARLNYQSAAAHYDEGTATAARLAHKMGRLYQRMGSWREAELQFENAAGALENGGDLSRLYADWSLTAHQSGQGERAENLAESARRLAVESGDQRALAQAHNLLGILARGHGDHKHAIEHLETSLKLAEAEGSPAARIASLNNLALVLADQDAVTDAIEHTRKALELCRKTGDRHRQAALHNNLADLYHAVGDSDAAMAELKRAVTIFSEIGVEPGADIPTQSEIWKLSEW